MQPAAAISALTLDFVITESADKSQMWILCAMKTHGPGLVKMLWRILGNEQDVCDAYQQVFLQMAHNDFGQKPRSVKAYLYRTAANIAISMLRRNRLRQKSWDVLAQNLSESQNVDYADYLDTEALRIELRAAIAQLPEYLRNVIVLRELGELSYHHVASTLGITVPTARIYRYKAVTILAAMLGAKRK